MNNVTATIENWRLYSYSKKDKVIFGNIYNDTNKRWEDGTPIRTSKIVSGKFEEGEIITTSNSTYLLGKKLEISTSQIKE